LKNELCKKSFLILDRDGVLNNKLDQYVLSPEHLDIHFEMIDLVCQVQEHGITVAVDTNQQCVGKNLLSPQKLNDIHDLTNTEIMKRGGQALNFFVCPHLESHLCGCRKPRPGLLVQAMQKLNFTPRDTVFLGDMESDQLAASNAGVSFVFHKNDFLQTRGLF
jgi:D-glycero-D-manno-heptose 1,7-bisphosphate phosphatase